MMNINNPNVVRRIFGIDKAKTGNDTQAEKKIRQYMEW